MNMNEIIGRNFARIRKEKNLTQREVAERIGIHQSYISALEQGKQNPRITKISNLAMALEIDHLQLFKSR